MLHPKLILLTCIFDPPQSVAYLWAAGKSFSNWDGKNMFLLLGSSLKSI